MAVGDSVLSQVDNPATLSLSPRNTTTFDYAGELLASSQNWSAPLNSTSTYFVTRPYPSLAIAHPVNDRLTFGLAVYPKAGIYNNYHLRPLFFPFKKEHMQSSFIDGAFVLNAAYKVTDKLSLGAGLRGELLTAKFNSVFGPVDADFSRVWVLGGGYQFGLYYQATKRLSLGMGYRSPSWLTACKDADAEGILLGVLPLSLGQGDLSRWTLPQRVNLGAAYDVTAWWKLIGEMRWINYHSSLFNTTTIETRGVLDLNFPLHLRYDDIWVFIAGSEFKLSNHWKLDVGYNYSTDPSHRSRLFPTAPALIQHHVSVGLRYEKNNWWVGGGYIYGFKSTQTGSGVSKIPLGVDYSFGRLEQEQNSIFFGAGFRW